MHLFKVKLVIGSLIVNFKLIAVTLEYGQQLLQTVEIAFASHGHKAGSAIPSAHFVGRAVSGTGQEKAHSIDHGSLDRQVNILDVDVDFIFNYNFGQVLHVAFSYCGVDRRLYSRS
jgi:hypothetical protein